MKPYRKPDIREFKPGFKYESLWKVVSGEEKWLETTLPNNYNLQPIFNALQLGLIRCVNRPYRPSNGTEGQSFIDTYCAKCRYDLVEHDPNTGIRCEIVSDSMCFNIGDGEYPDEWQLDDNGHGYCTKYSFHKWETDENGNWIMPEPELLFNPNQTTLEL